MYKVTYNWYDKDNPQLHGYETVTVETFIDVILSFREGLSVDGRIIPPSQILFAVEEE